MCQEEATRQLGGGPKEEMELRRANQRDHHESVMRAGRGKERSTGVLAKLHGGVGVGRLGLC